MQPVESGTAGMAPLHKGPSAVYPRTGRVESIALLRERLATIGDRATGDPYALVWHSRKGPLRCRIDVG